MYECTVGTKDAVWPLTLEDQIPQNYENRSKATVVVFAISYA